MCPLLLFPSKDDTISLEAVEESLFLSIILLFLGFSFELLEMLLYTRQLEVVEIVLVNERIILLGFGRDGPVVDKLNLLPPLDKFQPLLAFGLHNNNGT